MDEPKRMYAVVRDQEGELWARGRKLWTRQDDGYRCPWFLLVNQYGPVGNDAGCDDLEDRLRASRGTGRKL
ncbi:MAG TPA: hypothetical protein VK735_40055 [Pseudonocardia sp.]|uniref:hypothetical protein n=1 Tax=Pseudonocardia sp. TaxID=60912 RepID=UPI002C4DD90F|nr:hypothetical protein [Pseudonocardia sp.]HTF53679.1 hypothetical protein [Pseudonocardia sp.]